MTNSFEGNNDSDKSKSNDESEENLNPSNDFSQREALSRKNSESLEQDDHLRAQFADSDEEDSESDEKRRSVVLSGQFSQFTGPVPPPEILAEYENIQSGLAERILAMAEKEQIHRHKNQSKQIDAHINLSTINLEKSYQERRFGQICGLIIGVFAIGCGSYVAINDAEIVGGFIGASGVGGIVSVFVLGRKETEEDQTEIPPE